MLISYPIIPSGTDSQSEDEKLAAALANELLDEGTFPVAIDRRWHGGIHMRTGGEPIRAIADGEVVCYRCRDAVVQYPGQGDTDADFILLKHRSETGENTPVVFYSLYMHLANRTSLIPEQIAMLPRFWRDLRAEVATQRPETNIKLSRKEVIGFAGSVYSRADAFHFEIFATDQDLNKFWRDSRAVTTYGSNDVYGDMHFVVPPNQSFASRHPAAPPIGAHLLNFSTRQNLPLPEGIAGSSTDTIYVTIQFREGRYYSISRVEREGRFVKLGQEVVIDNYEYELYRQSVLLYPDCPTAGYEWLRFGRLLGPDITATPENIKPVRYSENALGYVDLAQANIQILSDADFPFWYGWQKIEESNPLYAADGTCHSATLLEVLNEADTDQNGELTSQELLTHLRQPQNSNVRTMLRHMIVRHPTEWLDDEASIESRYGDLKSEGQPLNAPDSWTNFVQHIQSFAFWSLSGIADKSIWHFNPLQFIRHLKKCGWLSVTEMLLLVPRHIIRKPGSHNSASNGYWESPNIVPARTLLSQHGLELRKTMRKYCIESSARRACYLANSTQETAWWSTLLESNGSQPTLHQGWYGRGFLQLTTPNGNINNGNNNYYKYFRFLGRSPLVPVTNQELSWRSEIGTSSFHSANSAGAYWVWSGKSAPSAQNPNRPTVDNTNVFADVQSVNERRTISTNSGVKVWYYNQAFANCAAAVNFPGATGNNPPNMNGLVDRSTAYINAVMILMDSPEFLNAQGALSLTPENFTRRVL